MNITHATREEINEIMPYLGESLEEGSRGYYKIDQDQAAKMVQDVLSEDGQIQVAKEDNQVVGWVLYGHQKDSFTGELIGFIYDLFVLPDYRSRGFAKSMMENAMTELKLQGMTSVRLVVYAGNEAKKLYEKLGFAENRTIMNKPL
ncbi:GNAT family N-acetyltransferase [Halobacillus sp. Marseille-P3879]|uniref:GNAT family N-acetyltransferase n=1 Tax=Halobacillus TaxID=45667 RepID=UPI000C7D4301|nr:GNAT family N-acetyltransferase [Halobacillus sp. Marseille-P3879]